MGSEMRLTGLASGFDWQPLVDRLIELESVPKQRLEAEKVQNQGKISELGVLKSRLNTLNSSATSLQNEDLFNARSVGVSSASANGFSANAEAGAMTGEFNISVESMATRTEMSSRNRSFGRLAGGLDLSASIKDLALFSDITPGTFTISGRTFSITNLNASLQDIIDEINTTFAGVTGVNPESDNTGITLEYDAVSDKFHFDTNALSPLAAENIPVLGSTTDTSNFLKAVGLLDRNLAYRNADFEAASNVSIFSSGDGSKAWLHGDDPSTIGHLNFAAFNGTLYERIKLENEYNPQSEYPLGSRVYKDGFVYESTADLKGSSWTGLEASSGDLAELNNQLYRLLVDLEATKVDNFSSVDSGNHLVTQATSSGSTSSSDAYKAGDIVKANDGTFFRSIKDRTEPGAENWSNYDPASGLSASIAANGWAGNIPASVFEGGRLYEPSDAYNANEHGGATDTTLYSSVNGWSDPLALVVGQSGTAVAENHYFRPKTSGWDQINDFSPTLSYNSGDIVRDGGNFWQANTNLAPGVFNAGDWTNVTTDVNDLAGAATGSNAVAQNLWEKVDFSVSNSAYWNEVAHANNSGDFDSNYWQEIKPEMNRFDLSGSGAAIQSIDYSIWARVGNVASSSGDAVTGNRDTNEEAIPDDGNFAYESWTGSASIGDYVEKNGVIYLATANTTLDPESASSENDWSIIADSSTTSLTVSEQANKSRFTDSDFWTKFTIPDPDKDSGHWKVVKERVIESSKPLGTVDMIAKLVDANFANSFTGLAAGLGNFFIGEGEGAVRIDYDINNDTLSDVIDRVNSSEANIELFYDPISGSFTARSKDTGATGITMHESSDWDTLSSTGVNVGTGNFLQLIGLVDPVVIADSYDQSNLSTYSKGTYVSISNGSFTTYWQALVDSPPEEPSSSSSSWRQIIPGVGRSMNDEIGNNAAVRINGGDMVFSTGAEFTGEEHGFDGITFNIAQVSIGGSASFSVAKDINPAKRAIENFVKEFNDTQKYIESLTKVNREGDEVSSATFTGNTEISSLPSKLRKIFFGSSMAHSESARTTDGSNLVINSNDASNTELNNISTQLNLSSSDDGYLVKVLDQDGTGKKAYFSWDGSSWQSTSAAFSSLRLPDIGMDFGIGSDELKVEDSDLLISMLEDDPKRVQALFAEEPTEDVFDENTQSKRSFRGITYGIEEFIDNFLSGEDGTGRKGAYQTHIDSINSQNDRIDDKVEQLTRYLASREEQLSNSFMKMEEMQSKMDTQMTTLQNSLPKKSSK
jgi:flagellar capping protein FliD